MGIETKIVEVTPDLAARWLQFNDHNRPLRQSTVNFYAREMAEGRWKFNGDAIRFSFDHSRRSDVLEDGQHRLQAVILSGCVIEMLVVRNIDRDSFSTIDTGVKRGAGDVLAINGEQNYNALAAALKLLWLWERGYLGKGTHLRPSNDEIADLLVANPAMRGSVSFCGAHKGLIIKNSIAAFLHYAFATRDKWLADKFMADLLTGVGLQSKDPVRLLRDRLVQDRIGKSRLIDREVIALVIKAWNFTRQHRTVRSLAWYSGGDRAEPFPEIE